MKISELVEILNNYKEKNGDIQVLVVGHPGEYGCEIEERDFFSREHEGKETLFISI